MHHVDHESAHPSAGVCPARGHTSLLTCSKINASQEKVKGPQSTFFPRISAWTTSPWFDFLLPQVPQCSRIRHDLHDVLPDSRAPVESRGVNISHYRGKKMAGRMISTTLSRFTLLTCLGGAQQGCTLWPFQWGSSGGPAGNRRKRMDALEQLAQKKGPAGKCRRHGRPRGPCGSRLIKMFPSCLFICSLVAPLPRRSVTRF